MAKFSTRTSIQMRELGSRLKSNPSFMSWVLATYEKQEHKHETDVIGLLDTTPDMFSRLALCKRPDSSCQEFIDDVNRIASYTSIDPNRLINLIRQVEALDTFKEMPNQLIGKSTEQRFSSPAGILAAARDRYEKEEQEPQSKENEEENDQSQDNSET